MSKIWSMVKSCCKALFCRETVSKVWTILFSGAKTAASGILANTEIMDAAFGIAKSLMSSDATSDEKKAAFDAAMKAYLTQQGREVGTSILNVVRETAVAAAKAELEQ